MINIKEFLSAMDQIAEEKGISKEEVTDIIEQALAAAYKKDYGERGENIRAEFNEETGKAEFSQVFLVVDKDMIYSENELKEMEEKREKDSDDKKEKEEPQEEEEEEEIKKVRFNPKRHMMIQDAKKEKKDIKAGEELVLPLETKEDFGRIAAQTAKQVVIQRIREAERNAVFEEFKEKEGDIVSGIVQRVERGVVHLDIGRSTGVIFPEEQIPHERYRSGQRIRVYVVRVEKDSRGPAIVLSRRHPRIVSKLFELEVPEIASGIVEIKSIAREAGSRTKIAVSSNEEGVDPVGSCVGQKGIRVSAVISELGGENIDITAWEEDPENFIANALSPAKVLNVDLDEENHTAVVDVSEDQLSLAIGRRGQNVRLAAKLTGWKIDVRGAEKLLEEEGVSEEEHKKEIEEAVAESNPSTTPEEEKGEEAEIEAGVEEEEEEEEEESDTDKNEDEDEEDNNKEKLDDKKED